MVTSLVEVSYLDPWAHPESDKVVWHLEELTGAKVISSLTLPNPISCKADDPADLEAMVDACRWTALDRLPDWSSDPLERAQHRSPASGTRRWSPREMGRGGRKQEYITTGAIFLPLLQK